MKRFTWAAVLLGGLLCGSAAQAGVVLGPSLDYKGPIDIPPNPSSIIIEIHLELPTISKVDWFGKIIITYDTIVRVITISLLEHGRTVPGLGAAWFEPDALDSSLMRVTTMYGVDLNPTGDELAMTGFDSELASIVSYDSETLFGLSGTKYAGTSLGTPSLAELPTLFPDHNLSIFSGDPSSIVYAFQTTVPVSDFTTPEPSTLIVVSLSGLALAWFHRRRARRRDQNPCDQRAGEIEADGNQFA